VLHVVVLSGAGVSAESGLATFRDSGGLWEGFNIEDVASIEGWYRDKKRVLEFYNKRREQAAEAQPNSGHRAIAELEEFFRVSVVTQNVDDLHERAGSTNVIHLHGMLREARSEKDPEYVVDIGNRPIELGEKAPDGSQLRPNVVWFGEAVPMIVVAAEAVMKADVFIVVGTSLAVYPAAGLINYTKNGIDKYVVDPSVPDMYLTDEWEHIKKGAATGLPELNEKLISNL
jgi:NAD-dependent deacetylase